jgi:hypothetical protein
MEVFMKKSIILSTLFVCAFGANVAAMEYSVPETTVESKTNTTTTNTQTTDSPSIITPGNILFPVVMNQIAISSFSPTLMQRARVLLTTTLTTTEQLILMAILAKYCPSLAFPTYFTSQLFASPSWNPLTWWRIAVRIPEFMLKGIGRNVLISKVNSIATQLLHKLGII